ncbi:hypothetical protein GE061_019933 [Apolygus lucorum]|uniref:Uncharacterized protein n=1 Tax=Apolygus lucorum TaxID=248454 RepID=A0A6A4JYS4_APOLU|nr:hypothetical protein GE061_019933 [Apolygus lucorum]
MADPYFIPTRSSQVLKKTAHEVTVHVEHKLDKSLKSKKKSSADDENDLDMKQARFEVYKFAQSGLPNAQRQKNQKELALKLGAVPPKNKGVNYKLLKKELAKKKSKSKEMADLSRLGYLHRPVRTFKNNSRNPNATLRKKMSLGTGILKKYDNVKINKRK